MRHPISGIVGISMQMFFLLFVCFPMDAARAGDGVTIRYGENAQIELIAPDNRRVLIDVNNPEGLSRPPTPTDVLLTTHNHGDHRRLDFIKIFPGQQLDVRTGRIQLPGIDVRGIASSHHADGNFRQAGGSNYIFIVDMAGLRIAHFGDIGQNALTADQLAALGTVDIAITQLANQFSDMTAVNKKGFALMDQLKPRLIIPTHILQPQCAKIASEKWIAYETYKSALTIAKEVLPDRTTIVFMGTNTHLVRLPQAEW